MTKCNSRQYAITIRGFSHKSWCRMLCSPRVDLFIYRKPFRQTNLNIMEGDDGVFDLSVKFNLPQVFYVEHIQIYGVTMMSS